MSSLKENVLGIKAGTEPSTNPIIMLYIKLNFLFNKRFITFSKTTTPKTSPITNGISLLICLNPKVIGCAITDKTYSYIPIVISKKEPLTPGTTFPTEYITPAKNKFKLAIKKESVLASRSILNTFLDKTKSTKQKIKVKTSTM